MLKNLIKDLLSTVGELEFETCERIDLLEKKLHEKEQIYNFSNFNKKTLSSPLIVGETKETSVIKVLQQELDELFQSLTTYDYCIEDQKKCIIAQQNKLEKLFKCLICETKKNQEVIVYVRSRLLSISNNNNKDWAFKYLSLEDIQTDNTIIDSIQNRIILLLNENSELKSKLKQSETDIKSADLSTQNAITLRDNDAKVLKKVALIVSEIIGQQIFWETNLDNVVHPLFPAMVTLQNVITENEKTIYLLKNNIVEFKEQLKKAELLLLNSDKEIKQLKTNLGQFRSENLYLRRITKLLLQNYEAILKLRPRNILESKEKYNQINDESRLHKKRSKLRENKLEINLKIFLEKMEREECNQRFKDQEQKYREIIDDLTNELASLSDQVSMAQEEFDQSEITPFEATLRELETQNDLLQKTIGDLELKVLRYESDFKSNEIEMQKVKAQSVSLQTIIEKKKAKYNDLHSQYETLLQVFNELKIRCQCEATQSVQFNESKDSASTALQSKKPQSLVHIFELLDRKTEELKAIKEYSADEKNRLIIANLELQDKVKQTEIQISLLEKTIEKRDEALREANTKLLGFAQQDEQNRMKEIIDGLSQELAEVKAIRRERESNLMAELNSSRQGSNDHVKAISKANDTIVNLERQAFGYRKQGDLLNKENAQLKAEIFKLKESLASQEGLEKSLRDQLRKTEEEMLKIKQDMDHYMNTNDDLDNMKRNCNRLKESNFDLVRKYNDLVEDFNTLEEEYRKLLEIKDQLLKEVDATRIWQHEQKKHDQLIETKIKKLEEHINTLMDDRQNLIRKIDELHRDAVLIGGELEHYKDVFTDSLSLVFVVVIAHISRTIWM